MYIRTIVVNELIFVLFSKSAIEKYPMEIKKRLCDGTDNWCQFRNSKGYHGIMKNLGRINFLAFENCCEIQMHYLSKDIIGQTIIDVCD